jgi:hypothetical protein
MYTRRSRFPLQPNSADRAAEIMKKYETVLHDLPGHVSTVMFLDGNDAMSISTWDTQEHADAVAGVRDAVQRDLAEILAGAPSGLTAATVVHDVR